MQVAAMSPEVFKYLVVDLLCAGAGDVSSMHAMMSCGSPLQGSLKRDIFEYFPCGIVELYGLTEGIITTLDPEDAEGRWSSDGAVFESQIEERLGTPTIIAVSLIGFGVLLWWADRLLGLREMEEFATRDALVVGGMQALALNPGFPFDGLLLLNVLL